MDQNKPKACQEAIKGPDYKKWLEAMRFEIGSMYTNQVWTLVDLLEWIKPIKCKWVFKRKIDMEGNLQTFKGQLVAKGFRQIHVICYDETFSLVAMLKSI